MNILVICQYYYPEPFRVNDYCEELVKRGHSITVVTGTPNYPMGEIYDGYKNGEKTDEIINGVMVHRCPIVGRKTGTIRRLINYYDFVLKSKKYVRSLTTEYDVVFVNQLSPVMMAAAGILYKKKHHKKLVLYCLDLWPESLVVGGIKSNSLVYNIFKSISKKIYSNADVILNTSKSFGNYFFEEFKLTNTEYLPQYAEDLFSIEKCRKEPNGHIDIMFAGNIGTAQDVETIVRAAKITSNDEAITWHIVGDGSQYSAVRKMAEGIDNIKFYGRMPLERMPEFYSQADAMVVTMENNPVISLTLPGKVQTYMAAGKPIIGAINGETPRTISDADCGVCCDAGDADGLAQIATQLKEMNLDKLAYNSRLYYEKNFVKEKFINKLELSLQNSI